MNENDKFIISTPAGLRLGDSEFETKKKFRILKKKDPDDARRRKFGDFSIFDIERRKVDVVVNVVNVEKDKRKTDNVRTALRYSGNYF
jgi:hypothetical protein